MAPAAEAEVRNAAAEPQGRPSLSGEEVEEAKVRALRRKMDGSTRGTLANGRPSLGVRGLVS